MKAFLRGFSVFLDFGITWPIRLLIILGITIHFLIMNGGEMTKQMLAGAFEALKEMWIRKIQWIKDGTPE